MKRSQLLNAISAKRSQLPSKDSTVTTPSGVFREPFRTSRSDVSPSLVGTNRVEPIKPDGGMKTWVSDQVNPWCKCGGVKELNYGKRTSPFRSECAECRRKRIREAHAKRARVRNYERMLRGL